MQRLPGPHNRLVLAGFALEQIRTGAKLKPKEIISKAARYAESMALPLNAKWTTGSSFLRVKKNNSSALPTSFNGPVVRRSEGSCRRVHHEGDQLVGPIQPYLVFATFELLTCVQNAQNDDLGWLDDEGHADAMLKSDNAQSRPDMITETAPLGEGFKSLEESMNACRVVSGNDGRGGLLADKPIDMR